MTVTDTTEASQTECLSFEFDLHRTPGKMWRALTDLTRPSLVLLARIP